MRVSSFFQSWMIDSPRRTVLFYPCIAPSSSHFCCRTRYHITTVAKVLSIVYVPVYMGLALVTIFSYHATTTLMAVTLAIFISAVSVHGTFRWRKLCLLPFVFMQLITVLYALIAILLLFYTIISRRCYLCRRIMAELMNMVPFLHYIYVALLMIVGLLIFIAIQLSVIWLLLRTYKFIAQVDRMIETARPFSKPLSEEDSKLYNLTSND